MAVLIKEKVKKMRLFNIAMAAFYLWFYDFIFSNYIVELFGPPYTPMDTVIQIWYYTSGIIPIFFYKGLSSIASVFSLFVYIFAYVPFNETLSVCGYSSEFNDYRIVFFTAMCLFFLTDRIEVCLKPFLRKPKIPYKRFEYVSFLILAIIVVINIRNLHLTNFITNSDDMYDLRENLSVVGGTIAVYLIFWLKNAILPIILVYNMNSNNRAKVVLVIAGYILLYMIDQAKLTIIAPFVILLLGNIYRIKPIVFRDYYHCLIMGALILFPFIIYKLKDISVSFYMLAAVLIHRTQCIEGLELNTYFNWFGHSGSHPYTYYTHINIINVFTGAYPYDTSIGKVVTGHGANANGMFWLMDGIAAGGLWGCVFISIIYIIVKSFFNGLSYKCNVSIFAVISTFAMASAMNVSLFTSLFSCGLIVFYLIFIFVDLTDFKCPEKCPARTHKSSLRFNLLNGRYRSQKRMKIY